MVVLEAQRLEETADDREEFLRKLGAEVERQAAEKNIKIAIPPIPTLHGAVESRQIVDKDMT